ncbi:GRF zinc finger [Geosmithia morbida]|uniref:2,5-diamino-6-ribosylamino-4(3H)-pyrimidinone 5'-phosphate reductase n=1 Tax=Geosmithia morbida TaxID=1094350 RepID=A0A9P5D9P5_9HYPO|nr:GRF zinc finger [Geosmithia morbida]KAF4126739.1 GRF zinc finger [Geosmithia morbida]
MQSFLTRKKRKSSAEDEVAKIEEEVVVINGNEDESTEVKLAILSSLHPHVDDEALMDVLLAHDGVVSRASTSLTGRPTKEVASQAVGYQSSLKQFITISTDVPSRKKLRSMTKRGETLHLFDPADVSEHTPCTIIHNFLPADVADALLRELLDESKTFEQDTFKLFDNVVSSPHTSSFYVESYDEIQRQKTEYHYNGTRVTDVRRITPQLVKAKPLVQEAVNREIQKRIAARYPDGRKLRYQSPDTWCPNMAFVNCYAGPTESVGWHSDQITYLGPRAVIGSVSLGVAREFRVRRVLPKDEVRDGADADAEGQISIHLPHNSLLVMHAEMQEEWKHTLSRAPSIDPHPISGNRRINVTYRHYRPSMHPRLTPRCTCGVPCVLRVVQRKRENFGRYFWMCYAGNVPGRDGCTFFRWAEFDDDGNPKGLLALQWPTMSDRLTFAATSAAQLEAYMPAAPAAPATAERQPKRPFVTLTFATSLDSSLSLAPGVRTRLSGPDSKAMTHYLRSRHSAILVGVSTMLADDPGLNCRIEGATSQPRPVIIDPRLRWTPRPEDKVLQLCRAGQGKAPLVITAAAHPAPQEKADVLGEHGGKYVHVAAGRDDGLFDWRDVLATLAAEGLDSVMVEGGATVINTLLAPRYHDLVDSVIVTVAPTWLGKGGVIVSPDRVHDGRGVPVPAVRLCDVRWHPFGEDVVMCGRLRSG